MNDLCQSNCWQAFGLAHSTLGRHQSRPCTLTDSAKQAMALLASQGHYPHPCLQEFGVTYLLRLNNQQKVLLNMFVVYEEARETVLPQRPATEEATTAYQWAAVTRGESAFACLAVVTFQLERSCG